MVSFICNLGKAGETLEAYFSEGKELNLSKENLKGNMEKKIMTECDLAECIHRIQGQKNSGNTMGWKRNPRWMC